MSPGVRTHALHAGYSDVSPGVGTRHLKILEEIELYCNDSIHVSVPRACVSKCYIPVCWAAIKSLDIVFSSGKFFLSQKKEEIMSITETSNSSTFEEIEGLPLYIK